MNRRQFLTGLSGILAAQWAPAVVGSGVLMPVKKIHTLDWIPYGQRLNLVTGEYEPCLYGPMPTGEFIPAELYPYNGNEIGHLSYLTCGR